MTWIDDLPPSATWVIWAFVAAIAVVAVAGALNPI